MSKLSAQQLIEAAGISRTHAYDIIAERQEPSLGVALEIYAKTGARFGLLKSLTDSAIGELQQKAAA
jgi:DNA-binding phage protein